MRCLPSRQLGAAFVDLLVVYIEHYKLQFKVLGFIHFLGQSLILNIVLALMCSNRKKIGP